MINIIGDWEYIKKIRDDMNVAGLAKLGISSTEKIKTMSSQQNSMGSTCLHLLTRLKIQFCWFLF